MRARSETVSRTTDRPTMFKNVRPFKLRFALFVSSAVHPSIDKTSHAIYYHGLFFLCFHEISSGAVRSGAVPVQSIMHAFYQPSSEKVSWQVDKRIHPWSIHLPLHHYVIPILGVIISSFMANSYFFIPLLQLVAR